MATTTASTTPTVPVSPTAGATTINTGNATPAQGANMQTNANLEAQYGAGNYNIDPTTGAVTPKTPSTTQPSTNNQPQIQAVTNQLNTAKTQLTAAQSAGYTGTTPINQGTQTQIPTPPSGIDVTTTQGQQQWYAQDPTSYKAWASANGQSDSQIAQTAQNSANDQLNQDAATYNDKLQQLASGTYPLTSAQQASLTALTNMWNSTITAQTSANETYVAAAGEAAFKAGGQYDITGSLANATRAIDTGINRIAAFQAEEAQQVAAMQEGFEKDNFDMVTGAYNAIMSNDKAISDEMTNTYNQVYTAQQDIIKNQQKAQEDQLAAIVADNTKSYQDKMASIDQQNADTTAKHDAAEEVIERETASNGNYSEDSYGNILDKRTGKIVGNVFGGVAGGQYSGTDEQGNSVTIGHTGNPMLDSNTSKTASGIPYIDGTNISAKNTTAAQLEANKLGIPFLTKAGAGTENSIQSATYNITAIQNAGKLILPTDAQGRIVGSPDRALSVVLQTDDDRASWNAWRAAAIMSIRAIAGGVGSGLRINQAEINLAMTNDIPTINDTIGVANGKLAKIASMLQDTEMPLFGGQDKYTWMKSASSPDPLTTYASASPAYGKLVATAIQKFPNYTNSQLMQILPGDVNDWAFPINNTLNTSNANE
jgi:hypothetical protein